MNITIDEVVGLVHAASWIELAVACIAVLVGTMILFRLIFGGKTRNSLPRADLALILGPSGSGKSALFFHWSMPGSKIQTVTSQSANRGRVLKSSNLEIIDYPGHPSLWHGVVSLLPRTAKIVYLIDSSWEKPKLKSVAENLYELLVAKALRPDTQLLVCRSKSDLKDSKSEESILTTLNEEIELLRNSRAQALDANETNWLGVDEEKFDLRSHCPIDVSFAAVSVKSGKVAHIESFLQ